MVVSVIVLLLPGNYWWRFLVVVSHGVDGVFDATDPLPFLGLHFVQVGANAGSNELHCIA